VRAAAAVHAAGDDWFETVARFEAGLRAPATIERVVSEGRRASADPSTVLGAPVPEPEYGASTTGLAEWVDLPDPPEHPLDTFGIGVPWNDEQLLVQHGHDLREASDAVRVGVV